MEKHQVLPIDNKKGEANKMVQINGWMCDFHMVERHCLHDQRGWDSDNVIANALYL